MHSLYTEFQGFTMPGIDNKLIINFVCGGGGVWLKPIYNNNNNNIGIYFIRRWDNLYNMLRTNTMCTLVHIKNPLSIILQSHLNL